MKKLLLSIFWLLMVLMPSFSSADYLNWLEFITNVTQSTSNSVYSTTLRQLWFTSSNWIVCFFINSFGWNNNLMLTFATTSNIRYRTAWTFHLKMFWCFDYNWELDTTMYVVNKNSWWVAFNLDFYFLPTDNINVVSWSPFYTSMQCQTEYNLIPIENVTENYCTSNFNLISPSDCPVSWWTWDINWSSVWINNQQVVWSPNIFLNIYDKLDWSQTYVNQDMYIDVNGPEGDEEYINWIIGINTYRPTSEDFTTVFVSGLSLLFPYIVITLFVLFIRKLIRKIFK